MDDTALDVDIKEEVGELFMGRSIEEGNDATVFPSGAILIHGQPTVTLTATDSRTETHLLSYTPVYMDEKGTPSFLQTSSPNTSIIPANNSDIQFVRQAIQPISSGSTRFSPVLRPPPKDPLEISPSEANQEIPTNPTTEVTIKNHFVCTLCGIIFNTFVERNEHVLGVHEHILCTPHRPRTNPNLALAPCHVNISIPTNQNIIQVHEEIVLSSHAEGSNVKCVEGETSKERRRRQNTEYARRSRQLRQQRETPEQRKTRLAVQAERQRKRLAKESEEQRKGRLAANAERNRKYLSSSTPEQRDVRLEVDADRQRKYLAGETPEQRTKRLAADAERNKQRLANETPEQRTQRLTANAQRNREKLANETTEQRTARLSVFVQCEYCDKSFARRSFRGHLIREHSKAEDKKFKCDHCEKTFAMEGDCKRHVLTHSKEKRFICEKCGKGFKDKTNLTNHVIFKHRFDPDVQEKYWQK